MRHPWYVGRGHPAFEHAVAIHRIDTDTDQARVSERGGLVFDTPDAALAAAFIANHPGGSPTLIPRARGRFMPVLVGGGSVDVYQAGGAALAVPPAVARA